MRLWHLFLEASLAAAQLYQQQAQTPLQYSTPCALLAALFPEQVVNPGEEGYAHAQEKYWSIQQAELIPACRFLPRGARDIQIALADVIHPSNASIAISSGGHSSVTGASNIDDGITFDLSDMSGVNVGDMEETVVLGPGARWRDVYRTLQKQNLTVSGGRVGSVGVGGYVLGGGFSWFANQYGWTCDTIIEFEVVTPQGEILWVNAGHHEDLFWALKGSLGAFGIVTKIKMPTLPNTVVYGGALSYEQPHFPLVCNALKNLAARAEDDLTTQGYLSFAWLQAEKRFEYDVYLINTEGQSSHEALAAFEAIPHLGGQLSTTTIGKSADDIDRSNPLGFRRFKFTLTSTLSPSAMTAVHDVVKTFTENTKFDPTGVVGVTFQPLTSSHLKAQKNIFNLIPSHGPLLLISVELWWNDADRDIYFSGKANKLQHDLEATLKKLDAFHPFIYPNYASREQNPFATLDPVTMRMLAATKRKYDPNDRWSKIVPGSTYLN
ncbi:hypothetical protein M409DRAFT_63369 [Zasmidium cellare ATCC 36951]|uniref:FAD-binding PCMH-type domain-containing protein n=1 Tax=Zasmidium cellare ATCC 36951 TaxID=1080233 RepID=A0A6A6D051_ZASCE|nr:uncharacterized protein M409DRAFT_63369 [Zasmidium cellare ATCC 36951]KAF2171788.1 hypothetical protein M409DRAFT_63369 [Zasmidium cellare ATCC 36951]